MKNEEQKFTTISQAINSALGNSFVNEGLIAKRFKDNIHLSNLSYGRRLTYEPIKSLKNNVKPKI